MYSRCFCVNLHAYVSFVKKLIFEGPLKRPKLKVCPILMKFSG